MAGSENRDYRLPDAKPAPNFDATPPDQSRVKGALLMLSGWLLLVLATATFLLSFLMFLDTLPLLSEGGGVMNASFLRVWLLLLVFTDAFFLIRWLTRLSHVLRMKARRHLVRSIGFSRIAEEGSYVLYLRTFEDDTRRSSFDDFQVTGPDSGLYMLAASGKTEEEKFVRAFKRIGKTIAVGAPGERLPFVGATRTYLPHDDWKDSISEAMRQARLVVLVLGRGAGTIWELEEALSILAPERLLLLVPMCANEYEDYRRYVWGGMAKRVRWRRGGSKSWCPFPEHPDGRDRYGMQFQGAIYFTSRGDPHFLKPVRGWPPYRSESAGVFGAWARIIHRNIAERNH
jgi:hypothetical protein